MDWLARVVVGRTQGFRRYTLVMVARGIATGIRSHLLSIYDDRRSAVSRWLEEGGQLCTIHTTLHTRLSDSIHGVLC